MYHRKMTIRFIIKGLDMASKKILVSGCSFTDGALWPELVFSNATIDNIGKAGAGNHYISRSTVSKVIQNHYDKVFILFSGVNRVDLPVPSNIHTANVSKNLKYAQKIDDVIYFFSGGDKWSQQIVKNYKNIKDSDWPEIFSIDDFLNLDDTIKHECIDKQIIKNNEQTMDLEKLLNLTFLINYLRGHESSLSQITYENLLFPILMLEKLNIDYNFGFIYDPFDTNFQSTMGILNKNDPRHKFINWNRYIPIFPLEISMKYNFTDDGFHLNKEGQNFFAKKLIEFGLK